MRNQAHQYNNTLQNLIPPPHTHTPIILRNQVWCLNLIDAPGSRHFSVHSNISWKNGAFFNWYFISTIDLMTYTSMPIIFQRSSLETNIRARFPSRISDFPVLRNEVTHKSRYIADIDLTFCLFFICFFFREKGIRKQKKKKAGLLNVWNQMPGESIRIRSSKIITYISMLSVSAV